MDSTPLLYSYWRSSCSYRVRIALNLKKIDYDYKSVHLVKNGGEQLSAEYSQLNPSKMVPSLVIDGVTLTQSWAIIEYLEESRPEYPLLPKNLNLRAKVREICGIIGCDIQPIANLRILKQAASLVTEEDQKEAAKLAWSKKFISDGFHALEAVLSKSSGQFCVGDEVTMADLFLAPQMYNALRFTVDLTPFPTIVRVYENMMKLDAFIKAEPSAQPDAE